MAKDEKALQIYGRTGLMVLNIAIAIDVLVCANLDRLWKFLNFFNIILIYIRCSKNLKMAKVCEVWLFWDLLR